MTQRRRDGRWREDATWKYLRFPGSDIEHRFRRSREAQVATAVQAAAMRRAGVSLTTIAAELGYRDGRAAYRAIFTFARTSGVAAAGRCRVCGVELQRNGSSGRLPELCEEHRRTSQRQRDAKRRARHERGQLRCVDCGRFLAETAGAQPQRCPPHADARALELRRRRDRARDSPRTRPRRADVIPAESDPRSATKERRKNVGSTR